MEDVKAIGIRSQFIGASSPPFWGPTGVGERDAVFGGPIQSAVRSATEGLRDLSLGPEKPDPRLILPKRVAVEDFGKPRVASYFLLSCKFCLAPLEIVLFQRKARLDNA
jgi:hypothetical protein